MEYVNQLIKRFDGRVSDVASSSARQATRDFNKGYITKEMYKKAIKRLRQFKDFKTH